MGLWVGEPVSHERGRIHETPDSRLPHTSQQRATSGVTYVGALCTIAITTHNVIVTPAGGRAGGLGSRCLMSMVLFETPDSRSLTRTAPHASSGVTYVGVLCTIAITTHNVIVTPAEGRAGAMVSRCRTNDNKHL